MNIGKALTWDELANLYDETRKGRPARTLPMERVLDWAKQQKSKFWINPDGGTIHRKIKDE